MEEKERFEIHIYDDVCVDLYNNGVLDKSVNDTYKLEKLLNQQDKRIKELCKQVIELNKENNILRKFKDDILIVQENPFQFWKENQQLKQQLHDLPKKIMGEVEKNFTEYLLLKDKTGAGFYSRLNAILKKYGGENE